VEPVLPDLAMAWADRVVESLRTDYLFQHVSVLLSTTDGGLVLAGQRWGAGEDVGVVVAGVWTVPFDGSVTGRVYRTGQPSLISDVRMDPEYRSYPGSTGRSELAVPIRVSDVVVGVVNLESPRVNAYGIRDLETVVDVLDAAIRSFPASA
jgi:GAF domain-containing protein